MESGDTNFQVTIIKMLKGFEKYMNKETETLNQTEHPEVQTKISESMWHRRKKRKVNETEDKAKWNTETQRTEKNVSVTWRQYQMV